VLQRAVTPALLAAANRDTCITLRGLLTGGRGRRLCQRRGKPPAWLGARGYLAGRRRAGLSPARMVAIFRFLLVTERIQFS
jgi:hypothetical protein